MISLLVLVPCRNEARIIERKLRNLAWCEWPVTDVPHRLVVIDDHSDDGTAAVAERWAAELFEGRPDLCVSVVANTTRPGKSGAIARGLAERAREELVFLTDADVIFEQRALVHLATAFATDRRLGMACASQRFAESLPMDGQVDVDVDSAAGLYDRLTAHVRGFESWFGMLISVHGQLLGWRAGCGIEPTPAMAADDLDLMLQVRASGDRIERIPESIFLEQKTPAGDDREHQAMRRARAYVQFLAHPRIDELATGGVFQRVQAWCYRRLPTSAPWLAIALPAVALVTAWLRYGGSVAAALLVALVLLMALPTGRRLVELLRLIARATRREAVEGMNDVWETARR